jgi:hypothetical protein
MFGWVIVSRQLQFHIYYLFVDFYEIFIKNVLTYHLRFIPEEVAEVSQIFLRDTHVLPK